jgi:hypothetical protein
MEQNALVALLERLKSETVSTKVWQSFKDWGQSVEDSMTEKAKAMWVYETYDITMVATPGTIQRFTDSKWLVGYKFDIVHNYFDLKDVEVGKLITFAFLAFDEAGKISRVYSNDQVSTFIPTNKPN